MKIKNVLIAGLIFLMVLSVSVYSITGHKQLGRMSGLTEEYIDVAKNLLEYDMAYPDDRLVYIYRPPGYIYFLKAILSVPAYIPRIEGEDRDIIIKRTQMSREWRSQPVFEFDDKLIFFSQAILHSMSAVIIYLIVGRFASIRLAFLLAITYGLNMYLIILVGLYHYSTLHIFFTLLSCYFTMLALERKDKLPILLAIAGSFWGLTTLIRPTTIMMPLFFGCFCAVYFKKDIRGAARCVAVFILGMMLTIAPTAVSNYIKTNKIIPVNAQGWTVFWANTVEGYRMEQNYFNWPDVWSSHGMPIYKKITKEEGYYFPQIILHNIALEDAFKEEAFKNIKHHPMLFVQNLARNFCYFLVNINSVMFKMFQAIQFTGINGADIQDWVKPGHPQDFYSSTAQRVFEALYYVILAASFIGGAMIVLKREKSLYFPIVAFLCFVIAHSLTVVDFMFYYIKLPFLIIFAGYAVFAFASKPLPCFLNSKRLTYGNLLLAVILSLEVSLLGMVLG